MISNPSVHKTDTSADRTFRKDLLAIIDSLAVLCSSADTWQRELLCESVVAGLLRPRDPSADADAFEELRDQARHADFRAIQMSEELKDIAAERLDRQGAMRIERWVDQQLVAQNTTAIRSFGPLLTSGASEFLIQKLKAEASKSRLT
jgi:hypothetical protein